MSRVKDHTATTAASREPSQFAPKYFQEKSDLWKQVIFFQYVPDKILDLSLLFEMKVHLLAVPLSFALLSTTVL